MTIFDWLRRRRLASPLARADPEALIHDHGIEAYHEARRQEHDVILPNGTTHAGRTPAHWRRVALIVAKRTGHAVGLDIATRVLTRQDVDEPVNAATVDHDEFVA